MDETTEAEARRILVNPVRSWSKQDHAFIYRLIKQGHRDALKALRNEALLDD